MMRTMRRSSSEPVQPTDNRNTLSEAALQLFDSQASSEYSLASTATCILNDRRKQRSMDELEQAFMKGFEMGRQQQASLLRTETRPIEALENGSAPPPFPAENDYSMLRAESGPVPFPAESCLKEVDYTMLKQQTGSVHFLELGEPEDDGTPGEPADESPFNDLTFNLSVEDTEEDTAVTPGPLQSTLLQERPQTHQQHFDRLQVPQTNCNRDSWSTGSASNASISPTPTGSVCMGERDASPSCGWSPMTTSPQNQPQTNPHNPPMIPLQYQQQPCPPNAPMAGQYPPQSTSPYTPQMAGPLSPQWCHAGTPYGLPYCLQAHMTPAPLVPLQQAPSTVHSAASERKVDTGSQSTKPKTLAEKIQAWQAKYGNHCPYPLANPANLKKSCRAVVVWFGGRNPKNGCRLSYGYVRIDAIWNAQKEQWDALRETVDAKVHFTAIKCCHVLHPETCNDQTCYRNLKKGEKVVVELGVDPEEQDGKPRPYKVKAAYADLHKRAIKCDDSRSKN